MNQAPVSVLMWSMGVQLGVDCLIALFFVILSYSIRLIQVRTWAAAWISYAISIGSAFFLMNFLYSNSLVNFRISIDDRLLLITYAAGKTAYALLFVQGILLHFRPGMPTQISSAKLLLIAGFWGLVLGLSVPTVLLILPVQWLMTAAVLCAGAIWALQQAPGSRSRWLAWVVMGEGILFSAYVPFLAPLLWGRNLSTHLIQYSSLFDTAADLLLALATLVALESARSENLERTNRDLQVSQEKLRQLVDLDPLTGLTNRRGLRDFLDRIREMGATLIFLDIDRFKDINDRYGHAVGDSCLIRMAGLLTETFRSQDGLFRWGGDEFLVVVPGLDPTLAEKRIEHVRAALTTPGPDAPSISVSLGLTRLEPGVKPDQALHEADQRMYADKRKRALM
jgi:diguanylate cyclase (GGDEF)-like protein